MAETVFRITQIEPQKHSQDRFSIYLNGAFAFGLDEEVVLKHHLHEGDELPESMIDDVLLSEERARAKKKALNLLSHSARSVQELRKRLIDYEFSERTVERVIRDFVRIGLLDDRSFASTFAISRLSQRPEGKRLLMLELIQKGIEEETAETAVEQAFASLSEEELARNLADRKLRQMDKEDKRKMKQKLSVFLFRRGFDWDIINPIVQEKVWENEQ